MIDYNKLHGQNLTKKYFTRINLSDVKSFKKLPSNLPDEREKIEIISEGSTETGHLDKNGQFKASFISPKINHNIWNELNYDGHFCFVDTNKLPKKIKCFEHCTHISGIYIFKVKSFKSDKNGCEVAIDYPNTIIDMYAFDGADNDNPEFLGWSRALKLLQDINSIKAKIFVDSEQNQLRKLSKDLPDGFDYYYASADRKPTFFNLVMQRLDRLINMTANDGSIPGGKNRVDKYLCGESIHLFETKS